MRAYTLADLATYLGRFAERAEARGTKVFFAEDASEAVGYVKALAAERGASLVAKAKSMASEEIGLAHALEADGEFSTCKYRLSSTPPVPV